MTQVRIAWNDRLKVITKNHWIPSAWRGESFD
jgi:hypothetical protein